MKREGRDSLLLRRMATQLGLIKNATVCWDIRHSILNNRNRGPDVKPMKSGRTFEKCTQILTMAECEHCQVSWDLLLYTGGQFFVSCTIAGK